MFSWYKYLIVNLVFSHLGFWSGNLFLIVPFPDLCLLVPFWSFYCIIQLFNANILRNSNSSIITARAQEICHINTRRFLLTINIVLHGYLCNNLCSYTCACTMWYVYGLSYTVTVSISHVITKTCPCNTKRFFEL